MRLLLDSHVLLWWLSAPETLPESTHAEIAAGRDVFVSAASVWEIEIKRALGTLDAPEDLLAELASEGFQQLDVSCEHAVTAGRLPRHHDDPFDRMLIAQASVEKLVLATRDARFRDYEVAILPA